MTHLNLLIKGKKVVFSGMVFNNKNQIEFTNSSDDLLKGYTFVFNEEAGTLEMKAKGKTISRKLESNQVEKLRKKRQEIHDYVIDLYMGILNDDERLLFLDTGLKEFPYIITSKSIIDAEVRSPKYNNALLYVFSDMILKANNKKIDFTFNDYESLQRELGNKVKKKNPRSNFRTEGQDVIGYKWSELVS